MDFFFSTQFSRQNNQTRANHMAFHTGKYGGWKKEHRPISLKPFKCLIFPWDKLSFVFPSARQLVLLQWCECDEMFPWGCLEGRNLCSLLSQDCFRRCWLKQIFKKKTAAVYRICCWRVVHEMIWIGPFSERIGWLICHGRVLRCLIYIYIYTYWISPWKLNRTWIKRKPTWSWVDPQTGHFL